MRPLFKNWKVTRTTAQELSPGPVPGSPAAGPSRGARIDDRFGLVLAAALEHRPYRLVRNAWLEDFLSVTHEPPAARGVLRRETRRRVDFLILSGPSAAPVLGIRLSTHRYGRDRRRPEAARTVEVERQSIIPILGLDPRAFLEREALWSALMPHLR